MTSTLGGGPVVSSCARTAAAPPTSQLIATTANRTLFMRSLLFSRFQPIVWVNGHTETCPQSQLIFVDRVRRVWPEIQPNLVRHCTPPSSPVQLFRGAGTLACAQITRLLVSTLSRVLDPPARWVTTAPPARNLLRCLLSSF